LDLYFREDTFKNWDNNFSNKDNFNEIANGSFGTEWNFSNSSDHGAVKNLSPFGKEAVSSGVRSQGMQEVSPYVNPSDSFTSMIGGQPFNPNISPNTSKFNINANGSGGATKFPPKGKAKQEESLSPIQKGQNGQRFGDFKAFETQSLQNAEPFRANFNTNQSQFNEYFANAGPDIAYQQQRNNRENMYSNPINVNPNASLGAYGLDGNVQQYNQYSTNNGGYTNYQFQPQEYFAPTQQNYKSSGTFANDKTDGGGNANQQTPFVRIKKRFSFLIHMYADKFP
jgi:hypothetical protein